MAIVIPLPRMAIAHKRWLDKHNYSRAAEPGKTANINLLVPYGLRRAIRMVCVRKDISQTDYVIGVLTREVISEIGDDWKSW